MNDLISRDDLIKDLKQYFQDGTLDCVSAKLALNMVLNKIRAIPSVNPCQNCDLYFKAMTKEEQKGGAV